MIIFKHVEDQHHNINRKRYETTKTYLSKHSYNRTKLSFTQKTTISHIAGHTTPKRYTRSTQTKCEVSIPSSLLL